MDERLAGLLGRVVDDDALHVDPSWVNSWGVVFGGVSVAALLDAWGDVAGVHLAFAKPVSGDRPVAIHVDGRQGRVEQDGVGAVEGFSVPARRRVDGPRVDGSAPHVPDPDAVPEATDHRTAAFIDTHFDLRVAPRRDRTTVYQWVRLRNLSDDVPPPLGVVGLLADLASVGVFRSAAKRLEGPHAVLALDLAVELTGRPPTPWTLMALTVPPIHDGTAVARAELYDIDRQPVAVVLQHTVVKPVRPAA